MGWKKEDARLIVATKRKANNGQVFNADWLTGGGIRCAKSAVVSLVSVEERSSTGCAKDVASLTTTAPVRRSDLGRKIRRGYLHDL
jgi:hypothetical protein